MDDLDRLIQARKAQFTRLERGVFYFYLVLIILLSAVLFGIPIYLALSK